MKLSLPRGSRLGCLRITKINTCFRDGFATRFPVDELTSTGRSSRGLPALTLREGDEIADLDIISLKNLKGTASIKTIER